MLAATSHAGVVRPEVPQALPGGWSRRRIDRFSRREGDAPGNARVAGCARTGGSTFAS